MTDDEIKEWDNALLDLINKGLVEINTMENGERGFQIRRNMVE